ncbi:MAG: transcription termination/antitermination protein NusG [Pelolinea sp.]|nr:transcription termination/antitermination protein NusG [Pelolinea sp.]
MVNEEEFNELEENQSDEEFSDTLEPEIESVGQEIIAGPKSSSSEEEIPAPAHKKPADEVEEVPAPAHKKPADEDDGRAWFVIHCYSGYENKVRHNLEQRIETMGMKDMIFDVVIPTQEEIEVKEGKRRSIERHVFPGYVLVNLILTEESWYVVRNTPGVTGFVGMGNDPTPLRTEEVAQILKRMEAEAPHVKVSFKAGERVHIIDGPFNDFRGTVSDIDMDHAKVTVMVNFFGRETPVELDFLQVEKS